MNAAIVEDPVILAASFAAMLGAFAGIWPSPSHSLPEPLDREIAEPAAESAIDLSSIEGRFDLSDLPAPPPPVAPPPDPAAALKRFRFAGSAVSGERRTALFEGDGQILPLRIGDVLAGFTFERIDGDEAVFTREGLEARLPLGPQ